MEFKLVAVFKELYGNVASSMTAKGLRTAVCRIAAKKPIHRAMVERKNQAGSFLHTLTFVKRNNIKTEADFGHLASAEPYFYDSSYRYVKRSSVLPIDTNRRFHVAELQDNEHKSKKT